MIESRKIKEQVVHPLVLYQKTKQEDELENWIENRLIFNPHNKSYMVDLYDDYCNYHKKKNFESFVLKKKTFANKLKKIFLEKVFNNEIKFYYEKSSQVLGISIKTLNHDN